MGKVRKKKGREGEEEKKWKGWTRKRGVDVCPLLAKLPASAHVRRYVSTVQASVSPHHRTKYQEFGACAPSPQSRAALKVSIQYWQDADHCCRRRPVASQSVTDVVNFGDCPAVRYVVLSFHVIVDPRG